jgi:hypothetical protein
MTLTSFNKLNQTSKNAREFVNAYNKFKPVFNAITKYKGNFPSTNEVHNLRAKYANSLNKLSKAHNALQRSIRR